MPRNCRFTRRIYNYFMTKRFLLTMSILSSEHETQRVTVIRSQRGWFEIDIRQIWRYRDLILLLIRRDFVSYYKQTILGPAWYLLHPLFSTMVFTVIFGRIARIPTDGLPPVLFYMSGIVLWNYFSSCLTKTSDTFVVNSGIFGKVYFPRLVVPISVVVTNLLSFGIQFGLFLALYLYFSFNGVSLHPNGWIAILPVLLIQTAVLGMGFGILVSSLTTKYRDLSFVLGFGVQLWMYATPIVYPLSQVPENWRAFYLVNPMASIIETFRYALLGSGTISFLQMGVSLAISVVIFLLGIVMFNRVEKNFMDTV